MLCVSIRHFLDGSTRPFLGNSDDGSLWVVKALRNHSKVKAIFNEYIAGVMANVLQLPWPQVDLIELSPSILGDLETINFHVSSRYGVALKYVAGLNRVPWPEGDLPCNAAHIRRIFPDLRKHTFFYGMSVFENWMLLGDPKYENLHIDPQGNPFFLDGSYALGGMEWDTEILEWVDHIDVHFPFLEGILVDQNEFEPWILKVEAISETLIEQTLNRVPSEWRIPQEYLSSCQTFLKTTKTHFVPLFRSWVRTFNV